MEKEDFINKFNEYYLSDENDFMKISKFLFESFIINNLKMDDTLKNEIQKSFRIKYNDESFTLKKNIQTLRNDFQILSGINYIQLENFIKKSPLIPVHYKHQADILFIEKSIKIENVITTLALTFSIYPDLSDFLTPLTNRLSRHRVKQLQTSKQKLPDAQLLNRLIDKYNFSNSSGTEQIKDVAKTMLDINLELSPSNVLDFRSFGTTTKEYKQEIKLYLKSILQDTSIERTQSMMERYFGLLPLFMLCYNMEFITGRENQYSFNDILHLFENTSITRRNSGIPRSEIKKIQDKFEAWSKRNNLERIN